MSKPKIKLSLKFFLLVFAISIPFWLIGATTEQLPKAIPINLPISSLMTFCPMIAALIITHREDKSGGMKNLLKRGFDFERIKKKIWYIPVIFLMPAIMILVYRVMRLMGLPLPEPYIPWQMIPIFLLIFFIGATGEEVGWSGYILDSMQNRWGALKAGIILGLVGAIWHVLPFIQAHRTPTWIAWQCFNLVASRVLIVWLYNSTGKSVFAAILFHATSNVSWFLFPNCGSHYDPTITSIIKASIAAIVPFGWGKKTLA
jgi:membrane protease YdiL (CAAX protease family)